MAGPAARDLASSRLPRSVIDATVEFIYGPMSENPYKLGKPLQGNMAGLWTARRGDFRIVYRIHDAKGEIEVMAVKSRADVYRP